MKKHIKLLIITIICLTISTTAVFAKSYIKELFQVKENLKIEKELDGTAFLAGTKVNIEKTINGIGFIAGETVTIKDKQDYLFIASSKTNMEANVENDLFIFSENANITGKVKRDSYIYATISKLDGTFDRNIYIGGNDVELKGTYNGNVTINATKIEIDDETEIKGTLKYNKNATITGLTKQIKTKTYTVENNKTTITDYIYSVLNSYINLTLLALLLVLLAEKLFKKSLEQTNKKGINNIMGLCIKGFVILIGIPIIAFMALTTGMLTSVGIIAAIIYGILIYISSIFTAYYIATELDKRYLKKNMNSYTLMILGLLILKVLTLIPIIGAFVSLFSLLLGLGISGNMIIELKTSKN